MDAQTILEEILQRYTEEVRSTEAEINLACDRFAEASSRLQALIDLSTTVRGDAQATPAELIAHETLHGVSEADAVDRAVQASLGPKLPKWNGGTTDDASALDAIYDEALTLFGSQKLPKAAEDSLALIILMARHRNDLRDHEEFSAGQTILHTEMQTELGGTTVRTLSHHLGAEFPASHIFSTENPFQEETLVGFLWNTSYRPDLLRIHDRLVSCVTENGFAPFKEVATLLQSDHPLTQEQGKDELKQLLPISLGIYLQSVA